MSDWWDNCPREAIAKHYATLQDYAELYALRDVYNCVVAATIYRNRANWHPEWSRMVHLRSLRIGRFHMIDTGPLTALTTLEELQLVVDKTCTNCVPLRRLTRLRELRITNGWVSDLVGYLPRLERLIWEDDCDTVNYVRGTLYERNPDLMGEYVEERSNGSSLRQLVLHATVFIQMDSPGVRKMLENVNQLEVCKHGQCNRLLPSIAQLRHLKRLSFREWKLPIVHRASNRRVSLACAESLKELFYQPKFLWDPSPIVPLPQRLSDRFPNLRVLASPFQESMKVLGELCPQLTHLHVPFSSSCAFSTMNKTSLSRLCVITLSISEGCRWLRQEHGPGHALPSLQRIFYPTSDCLSSPNCCQRHGTLVEPDSMFVRVKALRASWIHECDVWEWRTPDERRHRPKAIEVGHE